MARPGGLARTVQRIQLPQLSRSWAIPYSRRCSSTQAAEAAAPVEVPQQLELKELERDSSIMTPPGKKGNRAKIIKSGRRIKHSPGKYDRGPLHPVQALPASDPVARNFVPGPFNLPRLRQTYQSTFAPDIMTLTYMHKPPGTEEQEMKQRLRGWDGTSPYHKNRPLRGPRGDSVLRLLEKDITFRNIPEIRAVTVSTFVPKAIKTPSLLVSAQAMMQAITGTVPVVTKVKHNVAQWGVTQGQRTGCKTTLYGHAAYEFLDKCVHLVFPRIKDWQGIKGSTGDSSGNLSWGFTGEDMVFFPEIEANYSMYPPKSIPGCRVFVQTTAKSDRHARLLFQALGFPFYGLLRN